jgi:thiamine biosynthesis protein ThiS
VNLTVNGEGRQAPDGTTLSSLVKSLGLKREALVAEVNRAIVPPDGGGDLPLKDGDRIELIQFVGGG